MKVLKWLKNKKVPCNRNTVVTINGLRIHITKGSNEEFNSREDAILCEVYNRKKVIIYF